MLPPDTVAWLWLPSVWGSLGFDCWSSHRAPRQSGPGLLSKLCIDPRTEKHTRNMVLLEEFIASWYHVAPKGSRWCPTTAHAPGQGWTLGSAVFLGHFRVYPESALSLMQHEPLVSRARKTHRPSQSPQLGALRGDVEGSHDMRRVVNTFPKMCGKDDLGRSSEQ